MYISSRLALYFICLTVSRGRDAWRKALANIDCVLTRTEENRLMYSMRCRIDRDELFASGNLRDALHTAMFRVFTKYGSEIHWMKYFLWHLHTVFPENITKELAVRTMLEAKSFSANGNSRKFNRRLDGMRLCNEKFVQRFLSSTWFADLLNHICDWTDASHRVIR